MTAVLSGASGPQATEHIPDGCNLCRPALAELALTGVALPRTAEEGIIDGRLVDATCRVCSSRARLRVFDLVLQQAHAFRATADKALVASSPPNERRVIAKYARTLDHISYQGNHGDPTCRVGIDLTAMPDVPSATYDLAVASVVLDYIPDLPAVFREIRRVLRDDGMFLFFIQPWRVLPDASPARIVHHNALSHEAYAARPGAPTGVPDCRFGAEWIAAQAGLADLSLFALTRMDPISALMLTWYAAKASAPR